MGNQNYEGTIMTLPTSERIEMAKKCLDELTSRISKVIEIHENVEILAFSDVVRSKIPRSHAARAFNTVKNALMRYEVIRLVAVWEKPMSNAITIPMVVSLINDPDVIGLLQTQHFCSYVNRPIRNLTPSDDPVIEAVQQDMMKQHQMEFAEGQSREVPDKLKACIDRATLEVKEGVKLADNLRNHFAHSLDKTRLELAADVSTPSYDEISQLLDRSIKVIEELYLWVSGVSYDLSGAERSKARRDAAQLWNGMSFDLRATRP